MGEIRKIESGQKIIIIIDYSDLKEKEMMVLVDELKAMILRENKPQLILSLFNNKNFVTPGFMRHAEKSTKEALHLIDKMAVVGISDIQKFILKGYNLLFQKDYPAFNTEEEAIQYLISETKVS